MLMLTAPCLPFIGTSREDCRRNEKRGLTGARKGCLSLGIDLADLGKCDVLTSVEAGENISWGHIE